MAKLTKSETATLKRLQSKLDDEDETPQRRSTDKPKSNGHGDDVVVLRGARADSFLADLFGSSESDENEDDGDDGDDEDEDDDEDDKPPATIRWFR